MGRKKSKTEQKPARPKEKKPWLGKPKLDGVRWLWADNWYDWVLSGACEYQGKRYYGLCVDENYDKRYKWYRRYLLIDLPEEIWKEEDERHAFFRREGRLPLQFRRGAAVSPGA